MPNLSVEEKYGNVLFGDQRFTKSPEKNTKVENDAFFAIEEFIELSYGRRLKYNTIQLFESFLKIKEDKRYKDVLMPENYTHLYRGIGFNFEEDIVDRKRAIEFCKVLKLTESRVEKLWQGFNISYTYKPRNDVQSWSTSVEVAERFARGKDVGFIIRATPLKKELLFNTTFTNKVSQMAYNTNEYEIIRIGKSPLQCKVRVYGLKNMLCHFFTIIN